MSAEYNPAEYTEVPDGWDCIRLEDCTSDGIISYGIVQPGQHMEDGIPVLRVNNVTNGQLDLDDVLKVSPEVEKKYKRTRLNGGEVLLTLVGSTGQSLVVPASMKGWNVPRAIAVIRVKDEIGANWVNTCLQSSATKHFLDVRANTTVQKTLNLKDVRDIPILIPPSTIKEKIVSIEQSLSQKVETNRQINQTLEQIAQAIFKSWFVDFEPVKAKIAARETLLADNPTATAEEIAQAPSPQEIEEVERQAAIKAISGVGDVVPTEQLQTLADLFPNQLVESELGEIPEGWEGHTLGEHIDVLNGFAFKSKDYTENGTFVLRTKNFNSDSLVDRLGDDVFLPQEFLSSHKKYLCEPFDYHLIMVGASVGNRGLIFPNQLPALRNQNMWCLRPKSNSSIGKAFTKYLLDSLVDKTRGLASGSAREFFRKGDFQQQSIPVASLNLNNRFEKLVMPMLEQQSSLSAESKDLKAMRDTLLPKLLSGEMNLTTAKDAIDA